MSSAAFDHSAHPAESVTPTIHHPLLRKRIMAHAVRNIPGSKKIVQRLFQKPMSKVSKVPDPNNRNKYFNGPKFNYS